ncbi:MAG TPA: FAD-dependent oxidoreductase [Candidatus Cloacimonadota bacterium]|nr:FAD-dependent oxidoreductase [Candidatus Cloacimonadota bacterium]
MTYDLIIIGSGPAGYVSAIRAGQTGLKTLVIDKKYVGGMCLNWGCIPTKALIESAKTYRTVKTASAFGITGIAPEELGFDWKQAVTRTQGVVSRLSKGIEFLWKKNGVDFLSAEASILSPTTVSANNQIFETKAIAIATGSKPLPGPQGAIELEDLLQLELLPSKPVIWGRGSVALELAQMFDLLDRKPIIVTPKLPLVPQLDDHLNTWIERKLKKDKIQVLPESEVTYSNGKLIHQDKELEQDGIINAGFRAATLPESKVTLELHNGFIKTDADLQTSVPGIYAIGDVNGRSYLAHAASAQGLAMVDHLQGKEGGYSDAQIPINIYSKPEIAQVGQTERELKASGQDYQSQEFPLTANGKALAEGTAEGFIRLLFEPKYKQVLGVQIIAENATDMIAEAGLMLELEGTIYDLAKTVHAHPTVSEIFMEAGAAGVAALAVAPSPGC